MDRQGKRGLEQNTKRPKNWLPSSKGEKGGPVKRTVRDTRKSVVRTLKKK